MAQALDGIASDVEHLSERLRDLERRVATLEHQPETTPAQPEITATAAPGALPGPRPTVPSQGFPEGETPAGIVSVVGKAVVAIAGAFLLRAIAESGTIPKLPVLFVAILYACFWMVWAVRTHTASRFAGVTYASTSALILSPLLWESTVRFRVLSPASASMVLVAFVVLTLALARHRSVQAILWVATLASVITDLALIIATHELVPLTTALLAVALATEIAACLDYRLSLRAVPAIAADFAVWLLIDVMTSPEGVPEGYHSTDPITLTLLCFSLLVIYGGSIGIRSLGLRHRISIFEIGQGVLAFILVSVLAMRASHGAAAPVLGALFLLLAAVCYWGALSRFAEEAQTRNRRVYVTWASALLLAGTFFLFPANLRVLFLCVAALATVLAYTRKPEFSLGLHASIYLAAATAASSLPMYAANALAGTVPAGADWSVWTVAVSAALCYAMLSRGHEHQWSRRLACVVPVVVVGFAAAALVVVAIVWLADGRMELNLSRLAVIRTIVNCSLALALEFLGSRWKRVELGWVAYAAVGFGTLKLLFEDLRFGNAASLVVSFLCYGMVLILLPRFTRRGQTQS
jgi:hypothetical protein